MEDQKATDIHRDQLRKIVGEIGVAGILRRLVWITKEYSYTREEVTHMLSWVMNWLPTLEDNSKAQWVAPDRPSYIALEGWLWDKEEYCWWFCTDGEKNIAFHTPENLIYVENEEIEYSSLEELEKILDRVEMHNGVRVKLSKSVRESVKRNLKINKEST